MKFNLATVLWGLLILGIGGSGSGCSTVPGDAGDDARRLALAISTLSPVVDPREAEKAAGILTEESLRLATSYKTVGDPLFQNMLVNSGFRERGLCYHWVLDLVQALRQHEFRSLVFYRAGTKMGTYREHHTLVIVPYGGGFNDGLVVDAWQQQGRLHWVRVSGDSREWIPLIADSPTRYQ